MTDGVLRRWLTQIITERGLTTLIETGINYGGSTIQFSQIVDQVIGVEIDPVRIAAVEQKLRQYGILNVSLIQGNSPDILRGLLAEDMVDAEKTMFFLDAHWQTYWPLLDEIRALRPRKGVIVLHDVKVPGCPSLGWDNYGGQDLDYPYVQQALTEWSPTHTIEYNDDTAEEHRRGVMVVYP